MSERYKKLFDLTKDLYAEGAPAIIAAGALLMDTQTNRILAQMKFKSVSPIKILALKAQITALDTAGRSLGNPIEQQYLDLTAAIGDEFGAKVPIFLPDAAARSFSAKITEATFADGSVWTATSAPWEPLQPQSSLDFGNADLNDEFQRHYGAGFTYAFKREKDLWFCFCGKANKGDTCYFCAQERAWMEFYDPNELIAIRQERFAQEQAALERQREEAEKQAAIQKANAKKFKKIAAIVTPIIAACIALLIVINTVIIPTKKYNDALTLMEAKEYAKASIAFSALGNFKNSKDLVRQLTPRMMEELSSTIVTTGSHTLALKEDGTVIGAGEYFGECDFAGWNDIVSLATAQNFAAGLKSDGTVVTAARYYGDDRNIIAHCHDVVAIAAGERHAVVLYADGTVHASGDDTYGQCDIAEWTDIVSIAAGPYVTFGLKSDGTVVAAGNNNFGQCSVSEWTDIVAISASFYCTVGLKADGTVVTTESNQFEQCNVSEWTDIIAISSGKSHTVGLKADGTVVATGYSVDSRWVSDWTDIVAVAANGNVTLGLKSDGTIESIGAINNNQHDIVNWSNIKVRQGTVLK